MPTTTLLLLLLFSLFSCPRVTFENDLSLSTPFNIWLLIYLEKVSNSRKITSLLYCSVNDMFRANGTSSFQPLYILLCLLSLSSLNINARSVWVMLGH